MPYSINQKWAQKKKGLPGHLYKIISKDLEKKKIFYSPQKLRDIRRGKNKNLRDLYLFWEQFQILEEKVQQEREKKEARKLELNQQRELKKKQKEVRKNKNKTKPKKVKAIPVPKLKIKKIKMVLRTPDEEYMGEFKKGDIKIIRKLIDDYFLEIHTDSGAFIDDDMEARFMAVTAFVELIRMRETLSSSINILAFLRETARKYCRAYLHFITEIKKKNQTKSDVAKSENENLDFAKLVGNGVREFAFDIEKREITLKLNIEEIRKIYFELPALFKDDAPLYRAVLRELFMRGSKKYLSTTMTLAITLEELLKIRNDIYYRLSAHYPTMDISTLMILFELRRNEWFSQIEWQ